MDVLLSRLNTNAGPFKPGRRTLTISEPLLASTFSELVAEAHQLKRRGIGLVSLRRQQLLRIGRERLTEVLDDAGIRIASLGYAGGFTGTLGRGYRHAVEDTRRAIELAAEVGASAVITATGSRGLHTYRHAERTIRDGLYDCLDDALRLRITLYVPLTTLFGHRRDVFRPRQSSGLSWINEFDSHRIRGMMLLRGKPPWKELPDCWRQCLKDGGCLRVSKRSHVAVGTGGLLSTMLQSLNSLQPLPANSSQQSEDCQSVSERALPQAAESPMQG
jgi:hypothetical protein